MTANALPERSHSATSSRSARALALSLVLLTQLFFSWARLNAQVSEFALSDREIEKGDLVYIHIEKVFSQNVERRIISSVNDESTNVQVGYPIWVRNDGSIHLPYLDPIDVAGSKPSQIAPRILEAYQDRSLHLRPDLNELLPLRSEDISVYGVRSSPAFLEPDYVARPGDVLAVLVDWLIGRPDIPTPISYSTAGSLCPAFGYPMQVEADGTIQIPLTDAPIPVEGLSVSQIEEAIWVAITEKKKLLKGRNGRVMVAPFWVPRIGATINDEPLKPGNSVAVEFQQDWKVLDFSPSPIYVPLRGDAPPFTGLPFAIDKDGVLNIGGFEVAAAGLTLHELAHVARDAWNPGNQADYPVLRFSRISESLERRPLAPSTLIQRGQLLCLAGLPQSKDLPPRRFHFPHEPRFGPAYGVCIPVDLGGRIRLPSIGLIEAHNVTCEQLSRKILEEYRRRDVEDPSLRPGYYVEIRIVGGPRE